MHEAIVCKLENVRKHHDADRLQVATCLGYSVIIGLDSKEGDIVILFQDDLQLSPELCYHNNLYSKPELNKDTSKKGYLDSNKRNIKCQKLRGIKSEALVLYPEAFAFTGIKEFNIGDKFKELNEFKICDKYISQATKDAAQKNKSKEQEQEQSLAKKLKKIFKEHIDTEQLKHVRDSDLYGVAWIHLKGHGTSHRSAKLKIPVEQPLKWHQKLKYELYDAILGYETHLLNFFIPRDKREELRERPVIMEYRSIYGTRRVIKGEAISNTYREEVHKMIEPYIKNGETWYGEIVGYEGNEIPIMQRVSTKSMPKEFQKRFGETMTYSYGCKPYQFDFYLYRITVQAEDGEIYELPWNEVKKRATECGIKTFPCFGFKVISSEQDVKDLRNSIDYLVEEELEDPIDPSHIREGVIVRIENEKGTKWIKSKSFTFRMLEGVIKDSGVVDTEELESIEDSE